ncbi:MAG: hypothetical protein UT84_C0011G0019 [Candidatus Curtissbacteria bacterium GW2011_GWA1_40_16]|uniref:Putative pre-16S rRNA nuclease n=1 Tax=Candidatus Curtissbacteria bacterium GW2011_GWA1_40_16 TaxID=1618405 RepID=A0A0G0RDI2_9BACT|nr:MAG: hypothetical protein UT84_C0011G0019 [Candidatus Curtissbacteria bacterium GW2011_GWA1_40_16]
MYLGIDLGRKKTGLAISEGSIASPYKTITHKSLREVSEKVIKEIDNLSAEIIVLGFVEGKNKGYFEKFGKLIKTKRPNIKVVMEDETLTTGQARQTMVKLGLPQKKKSKKEDAIAASIILQGYLNAND